MQTSFTPEQRAQPDIAESEKALRACVHCGFCLATCPTYLLLGDERDSPRGRIVLIKDMLESGRPADATVVTHIDRCLSCLACMTTCPSGVNYMHLVDHARRHIAATFRRPLGERLLRRLLAAVLPRPRRFRLALQGARLARPLVRAASRWLPKSIRAQAGEMLALAPRRLPDDRPLTPGTFDAQGKRRARVALLTGCAQDVLAPHINQATVRLLNRLGCEVVVAKGAGCCGALVHHLGRDAAAQARANIAAWRPLVEAGGLDGIIATASGCGTMLKDYGFILRDDAEWREPAARVAGLARDVSEIITRLGLPTSARAPRPLRVAYQSACSMLHGQRLRTEPQALLRAAGYTVAEPAEAHICCGSAGTYNILQPELATKLRARKAAAIAALKPDLVASGNIGCLTQLAGTLPAPVAHTVELLDWATGGPPPLKYGMA